MIYRRTILSTCFCLLTTTALCPLATAQPTLQPTKAAFAAVGEHESVATIAINSYDNLLADADFIGSLAGYPEIGNMVEGFIALFTQGKGLAGLDKSKPWGVLVTTDGKEFMPIGCLPVHDSKDLLQLLAAFQIRVDERDDGLVEITTPQGPPLFVREKDGWAYISNKSEYLDPVPANPEQQFRSLIKDYDLAVQASVQKIPSEYRNLAIEQLRAGLQEGLKKEADEDDETFKTRKQLAEAQLQNIVTGLDEMDQVVIGWAIDSSKQNTYFDFIYRVLPESDLSKLLASIAANVHSNYAGFYQPESAACLTFIAKSDPKFNERGIEQLKVTMSALREQIANGIDKDDEDLLKNANTKAALKKAVFGFLDAFEETAATGKSAGGAVLDLSPDWLTVVVGCYVKDPSKFDESLRELAKIAEKEPDFPGVNWNADEHEGITFHTMQVPIGDDDDDEQAKKLLGPTADFSIGVGKESVYFGFGRDNLGRTKEIIDSSLAQPNKSMPIAEWMVSLGPIMEVVAEFSDSDDPQQKKILQTIVQMLRNESQGKDHVTAVATPIKNGLRYRIIIEEGVLRALGKAAAAASQAAAGSGS